CASIHLKRRGGRTALAASSMTRLAPLSSRSLRTSGDRPSRTGMLRSSAFAARSAGGPGNIALILRTEPPSRLVVEHLEMGYHGSVFYFNEQRGETLIRTPTGAILAGQGGTRVQFEGPTRAAFILDGDGNLSFGG